MSTEPINLLYFTNLFPTPVDPERGVFTLQLLKEMRNHCRLTVVCPLPWFPRLSPLRRYRKWYRFAEVPATARIGGLEVYYPKYPLLPKVSLNYHPFLMAMGVRRLLGELHRRQRFDIVNSSWMYPDSVCIHRLRGLLDIPHVATGRGCDVNVYIDSGRRGRQILEMLDAAAAITVVSNNLREVLLHKGIDEARVSVIMNGVNQDKFHVRDRDKCRAALGIDQGGFVYLYVGRLSEEKGVTALIEAFTRQNDRSSVLYLVGDGEMRGSCETLVRQRGLTGRVIFHGWAAHDEIPLWIGACDALCLPSLREGCPNVVLESLASGRPVLGSRVGAVPDVVRPGENGLLFGPGEPESIAAALSGARSVDWDAGAIRHTVQRFRWEQAAQSYLELYASLVRSPAYAANA